MAASQARRHRAEADALSQQARNAARHLRHTEDLAAATQARIDALDTRRRDLQAALRRERAGLEALLPLALRLSLYPAETLLAAPTDPANTLSGLAVLRGLGAQLQARTEALRAHLHEIDRLSATLRAQDRGLMLLRHEQAARGAQVEARAQAAAAAQQTAQEAVDRAARAAAADAAHAADLKGAIARLAATEQAAAARFQRAARAARAQTATGSGLTSRAPRNAQIMAPVAGAMVQHWGAHTDAGPAHGVTYAPPALAVVTAPCRGQVDFAGPFRSYGHLVILDCGHGYRFVLAGLDRLDVAIGQTLRTGAPLGRMPDWHADSKIGRPALYVQLRHGSEAVDPMGFLGRGS
ncbi:murein hydrolase activator EnvC family protein [Lichenicoccus sp.]|uniref:murein hydrolase activator EnvC family protein n=1 Tax=Lichenicoccus sp. TaxID=2781899 RepID=UPI003D0F6496